MQYLDRLTDQQIIEIIGISLDNFQVYGAHQYSPDLIGHRLHKMLSYIGDVTLLTHELEKEIQKNYPEATQLASIVSKLQEMNK